MTETLSDRRKIDTACDWDLPNRREIDTARDWDVVKPSRKPANIRSKLYFCSADSGGSTCPWPSGAPLDDGRHQGHDWRVRESVHCPRFPWRLRGAGVPPRAGGDPAEAELHSGEGLGQDHHRQYSLSGSPPPSLMASTAGIDQPGEPRPLRCLLFGLHLHG